jgi:DNA-binding transcriptional ArsR family regulator
LSRLTDVFKALSDPTRREILAMLRQGDKSAGEIADAFSITKPSISHHLSQLRQAGLVSDTRQGQSIVYSLETTAFQDLMAWVMSLSTQPKEKEGADHDR